MHETQTAIFAERSRRFQAITNGSNDEFYDPEILREPPQFFMCGSEGRNRRITSSILVESLDEARQILHQERWQESAISVFDLDNGDEYKVERKRFVPSAPTARAVFA
jgi:hypothetical protein